MMDKQRNGGADDFSDLDELADLEPLEEPEPLPELPDEVEELPELPDDAVPHTPAPVAPTPAAKPKPAPVAKPAPTPAAKPEPAPVAKPEPAPVAKPEPAPVAEPRPAPAAPPEAAAVPPAAKPVAPAAADPKPAASEPVLRAKPEPNEPGSGAPEGSSSAGTPAPGAGGPPAGRAPTGAGTPPAGKRELERAPLLLRKAAVIVTAGSILPWSSEDAIGAGEITWAGSLGAKALLLIAVAIIYQSHIATHGGKVVGALAGLGKLTIPIGKKARLNGLVPLALVFALVGLYPLEGRFLFTSFSEKLILLLAGYTFAHIYDYEHGGRFNPIYPLMFLAPAIGGLAAIFSPVGIIGKLGAAAVGFGGVLACYTLGMAMAQAKKEGDAKRLAAREARKAARAAGGGRPAARSRPAPRAKGAGGGKGPAAGA